MPRFRIRKKFKKLGIDLRSGDDIVMISNLTNWRQNIYHVSCDRCDLVNLIVYNSYADHNIRA